MNKFYYFAYVLLFLCLQGMAQTQLTHEKGSYVDSLNHYYQQAELPLYVYVSHTPNQAPTQIAEERSETDNGKKDLKPIYLDGHGKHYLRHIDGLHNVSQNFAVYADGIAPKSDVSFLTAPRFNRNGIQYYGKGLTVTTSTRDEMSGINTLYSAVTGASYTAYNGAITFGTEGEQSYAFYAVDNVGNVEKANTRKFVVDLTSPESYHNVVGVAKEKIISLSTKIYLTISDKLSGVNGTYYRFDDGKWRERRTSGISPGSTNIQQYGHTTVLMMANGVNMCLIQCYP